MGEQNGSQISLVEDFKGLDIFDIDQGGTTKRVAFGQIPQGVDIEKVSQMPEIIPVNSYDITGLARQSKDGDQFQDDFIHALAGTNLSKDTSGIEAGPLSASQVSAALYAGSRGDETAMAEFQKMVAVGRKRVEVETAKRASTTLVDPTIKAIPDAIVPGTAAHEVALREEGQAVMDHKRMIYESGLGQGGQADKAVKRSKEMGLWADDVKESDTSNLFLFHEKPVDYGGFEFDDQGNLLLRPQGDYQVTDDQIDYFKTQSPEGAPIPKIGDPIAKFHRRTIHMGINGPVAPVINDGGLSAGRVVPDAHAAMFRLDDALESNPGSVDNLLAEDAMLTPPAGRPLMIPKGKFRIISKKAGVQGWTDTAGVATTVEDTAVSMGANREMFSQQTFSQGMTESENISMKRIARGKYGVDTQAHNGMIQYGMDEVDSNSFYGAEGHILSAAEIAETSRNWATTYYDSGFPIGAVKGITRTNINKEAADKLGIIIKTHADIYDTV